MQPIVSNTAADLAYMAGIIEQPSDALIALRHGYVERMHVLNKTGAASA